MRFSQTPDLCFPVNQRRSFMLAALHAVNQMDLAAQGTRADGVSPPLTIQCLVPLCYETTCFQAPSAHRPATMPVIRLLLCSDALVACRLCSIPSQAESWLPVDPAESQPPLGCDQCLLEERHTLHCCSFLATTPRCCSTDCVQRCTKTSQ